MLGLALMFVGLGFKVVAAPFQIYAPDVYEGAPSPVTALARFRPQGSYLCGDAARFRGGLRLEPRNTGSGPFPFPRF